MLDACTIAVFEALTVGRVLEIALWVGLAVVSVGLVVLLGTSWGQSKPLQKCTILSLLVHVLLAFYAMTVRFQTAGGTGDDRRSVSVTFVDRGDEVDQVPERAADANPWDDLPTEDTVVEIPEVTSVATPAEENLIEAFDEVLPPPEPLDDIAIAVSAPPLTLAPREPLADVPLPVEAAHATLEAAAATAIDVPAPAPVDPSTSPSLADVSPAEAVPPQEVAVENMAPRPDASSEVAAAALQGQNETEAATLDEVPLPTDVPEALAGVDAAGEANEAAGDVAEMADAPPALDLDELSPAAVAGSGDEIAEAAYDPGAAGIAPVTVDTTIRQVPEVYRLRVAPNRDELARARGATAQSEGAVAAALAWLAANQESDGRWNAFRHAAGRERSVLGHQRLGLDRTVAGVRADSGVTGLALLAMMGSGHTHTREGPYREHVIRGLNYLRSIQAADGNLGGNASTYAHMYCHGMATFALSEAYAMTGDAALADAVRRATQYSLESQNPYTGGWRYLPWRERKDDRGDTSQLGWQLMALESAQLAGIKMPSASHEGMLKFISSVEQGQYGGLASYRPDEPVSAAMTAEALTCRLFLGSRPSQLAVHEASDLLLRNAPGTGAMNLYFWYYATLGLYQTGGEAWGQWNAALQETLPRLQVSSGEWAGTWPTDDVWGGYGGRVYTTAMGALCLEVYYRYLPLYVETAGLDVQRR